MATKDEFDEWLLNPVTKDLKTRIRKDIQFMLDVLVEADLESVRDLQGRIKASQALLEVAYEDLYE